MPEVAVTLLLMEMRMWKNIRISGYTGIAMLKIEQENDVEVRKIVIE